MRWLMAIALVLMMNTVQAGELTDKQLNKQKWFHIATVADAVTTIIGGTCVTVKEINPILKGADPTTVIGFFLARNIAQEYITKDVIPQEWRDTWQNTWIGAQSIVVVNNTRLLLKHC